MLFKKNQFDARKYKEYLNIYLVNMHDNNIEKKNHDDLHKIIERIKKDYENNINNNELDIMTEKIRLKHIVGKYNTSVLSNVASFYIAISSGLFALFMQSMDIFNINIYFLSKTGSDLINMVLKVGIFLLLLWFIGKNLIDTEKEKGNKISILNSIRLEVIIQIEKEYQEKKLKNNLVSEESPVTLDNENKLDKILENTEEIKKFFGINK